MKDPVKIVVYVVFWTIAYFVLLGIFANSSQWQSIDYIYTAIFTITLMIAVTVNEGYLRRRFLNSGRYSIWIGLSIVNVAICAWFNHILFDRLIDFILPGYYFISYYNYIDLLKFFVAFVSLAALIGFSMEWFELQDERRRLALLEKEKVNAEFRALVNQVNPHFLFNGLTILYALSLKESQETSAAVIKLSDILRYMIYQSSADSVSLGSEAKLMHDYIDLQRYRVHPSTLIEFSEEINDYGFKISPLLFLPLVENAFKHGVHNETENAFVRMTLRERNGVVNFTIVNNRPVRTEDASAGIGLKNLKERLHLLYPQKHSFVVTETGDVFNIDMQIST